MQIQIKSNFFIRVLPYTKISNIPPKNQISFIYLGMLFLSFTVRMYIAKINVMLLAKITGKERIKTPKISQHIKPRLNIKNMDKEIAAVSFVL